MNKQLWLLDQYKRIRTIKLLYRCILKVLPFPMPQVRDQLEQYRKCNKIHLIVLQFNTMRAFYRLLLKQEVRNNQIKLVRLYYNHTLYHCQQPLYVMKRLKHNQKYQKLNNNDQQYIEQLLEQSIHTNNDPVQGKYKSLLQYIEDKNSEKLDKKLIPPLNKTLECPSDAYLDIVQYLK